jgi:hypothetical protein
MARDREPWPCAPAHGSRVRRDSDASRFMHGDILTPPWRHRPRFSQSQVNVSSQDYSVRWAGIIYAFFFSFSFYSRTKTKK